MLYTSHPSIHVFVDVLKKVQANAYTSSQETVMSTNQLLIRKGAAKNLQSAVKARTDLETNQISMKRYTMNLGRNFFILF